MSDHSNTDDSVQLALRAVLEILTTGQRENIPGELKDDAVLQQIVLYLNNVQDLARSIANGDLSQTVQEKGALAGSLKNVQASLRHLTWQTKMIAQGDYSQRVDYMGEFSMAFNELIQRLQTTAIELETKQVELAQTNAQLLQAMEATALAATALATTAECRKTEIALAECQACLRGARADNQRTQRGH